MASELYVETLKGLTSGANANKVIIPSGQTLYAPGHVIQVVQYENESQGSFSGTNTAESWTDVLTSATITPTSSSSKILITLHGVGGGLNNTYQMSWRVVRDIAGGGYNPFGGSTDPDSNWLGTNVWCSGSPSEIEEALHVSATYIDTPSTTSQITYKVQMQGGEVGTYYYNRGYNTNSARTWPNAGSTTLTLMEIAG